MNRLTSFVLSLMLFSFPGHVLAGWESWRAFKDPKGGGVNVRTTNPGYPREKSEMERHEATIRARFDEMARLLKDAGFEELRVENIGGRDFSSGKKLGHDCKITLEYLYDHDKRQYNPGNRISCADGKADVLLPPMQNTSDVRKTFDRFQEVYRAAPGKSK